MSISLNDRQAAKVGSALRRGAIDAMRVADALDRTGRTHWLIEVTDMGQFATDWDQLKQIIRQKDDALDGQAGQLAAQAQQVAALQQQLAGLVQQQPDAADRKALAELHQAVSDNAPATPIPAPAPVTNQPVGSAGPAGVTTFTK